MNEQEILLAKQTLPSFISELEEELGHDRIAWFLKLMSATVWHEGRRQFVFVYSNWDIQRIVLKAFGIDLRPWRITVWRQAYLPGRQTLVPEIEAYMERPLALIEGALHEQKDSDAQAG
jgi:hypothetical protein